MASRTSPTIASAKSRARKHGWNPAWVKQELDARAVLDHGCYVDEVEAARVVAFFGKVLRHADTSRQGQVGPFVLMPWQEHHFLRPLFGWKRGDGTRRHRRGGLWVAKKNGKSTLCAGLENYMLFGDRELGAEVYSAANDRSQAGIIYNHAARMVELSPILATRVGRSGIIRSTKTIYDKQTGSTFKALSADAPTKEGLNIHALIVDEIHAMKSRALWDTLVYGGSARAQPLILSISTAGIHEIGSIGWEQYSYARAIANGINTDDWAFFALLYEAPPDADWTAPTTWRQANPSFGVTVKVDRLAEECTEARTQPAKQNNFRRYRLNQWVQQVTRWIPLATWDANHVHPVSRVTLAGAAAYVGLDLGSVSDLTAAAIVVECPSQDDALDVLMRFWVPEAALDDEKNPNRLLYQQWHATIVDGVPLLETTPGTATDYDFIEAAILQEAQTFAIKAVGIDRLFQGQQVSNHLSDAGLVVVAVGQGFVGQGPPMKEFERRWLKRAIHHGAHPVLRWMADNVEVKQDPAGNLKIVKPHSRMDPRKVDGVQALVNAIDQVARAAPPPEPQFQLIFLGGGR
jgi:phage terminase large subunit-like protein